MGFAPAIAHATNAQEFPDNGSEQFGRGGAWVARASDPLATFYNPAGLAGQRTRLTLQANVSLLATCFTRVKASNDTTSDGFAPGATYPQVCNDTQPFADPQLAFAWRLTDRVGLGFAVLGPSGVGNTSWPEFVNGDQPAPQRYLLLKANVVYLTPTIGVGWEAVDGLRLGAAVIVGTAPRINFANASPGLNEDNAHPADNDVRAELTAKQLLVPGFTLGAIWSPTESIDVAGWYKWSAPIDATGDVQTSANYFTHAVSAGNTGGVAYGDTSQPNCDVPNGKAVCGSGDNASLKVRVPMEAKLGLRFHVPRAAAATAAADAPVQPHVRDPMAQDVFDVEADFTWANNSTFDALELRFPADASGGGKIPVYGTAGGTLPPNADVQHHYKDVAGVRVGGDYNALPDRLAIRAGAFAETRGQDATWQNIDFAPSRRVGVAAGGTYRIKMGEGDAHALDLMLAFGHVFFGTTDNSDPNAPGLHGLAGSACNPAGAPQNGTCANGNQAYRTNWAINLGTITNSLNVVNVGATYKF